MSFDIKNLRIGIVGLGYVGLPLAVEFGKQYPTVGFDINADRVAELETGEDATLECSSEELAEAKHLSYSSSANDLADCNFYVVTVPTPIGDSNRPLLTPLRAASNTLGGCSEEGRHRRLRIHGVSGRDRGILCAAARRKFGLEDEH